MRREVFRYGRMVAGLLVCLAAGALTSVGLSVGSDAASAAAYYYCPGGGAGGVYGYCPPTTTTTTQPQPQASTLTLAPATDTNPVDSSHTVTATVRDQFGSPMNGVTVRFTVTGATSASGSCTTSGAGQCTFTYTGPPLPGADTISAYADADNDTVNDPTPADPEATAAKTWAVPASTPGCKVSYGVRITAANGDKATVGGTAQANGRKGTQSYQDHGPAVRLMVKSVDVDAVVCAVDGTSASIFGTATVNGAGFFDYRVDVRDVREPGSSDTYRLRLSNGYDSGAQLLFGGNVQVR